MKKNLLTNKMICNAYKHTVIYKHENALLLREIRDFKHIKHNQYISVSKNAIKLKLACEKLGSNT